MKNEEKKSKNGCGGHLVFQNGAKSYERHAFIDINLLCKFGEFMFINKGVMKPFININSPNLHKRFMSTKASLF